MSAGASVALIPKYVASRTLREPLVWQNSRLLGSDLAQSVAALNSETGNDLLVIGSTELAAALLEHDLVDEIRLMIDPVMLGSGKRFFRDAATSDAVRAAGRCGRSAPFATDRV